MNKSTPITVKAGRCNSLECSVSGTLALVFRVSQLVGMGPLTFRKRGNGWVVSISPFLCMVTYLAATVMNIAAMTGLLLDLQAKPSHSARVPSPTKKFVWISDYIVVMLIASVAMYGAPKRLKTIVMCLARLQKLNVPDHSNSPGERKSSAILTIFLIFVVCVLTSDYSVFIREILLLNKEFKAACFYAFYYFAYLLLVLLEMEYIFTTLEVSKSLRGLNKLIEELAHLLNMNCSPDNKIKSHYEIKMPNKFLNSMIDSMTTVDTGFTITLPSKTMSDIRRLASMYPEVCEVAKEMDSCHDVGVLLLLLSFLLHLVITPYYLIVKITSSRCLDIAAGVQVLWCGLHLACTFVAAEPSYRTQLEVKRINSLIARMILQSNNGLVLKELKKFSTCLLLNEISYSPLGLCSVTRSLITSIIGSVATYLVIIIQFQLSEQ